MGQIRDQLVELFLQAAPTVVIIYLFYFFLRANLFRPLEKVMAERSARIEGAREAGNRAREWAEMKEKAYEDSLRKARAEIYVQQEAARAAALEERAVVTREARERALKEVQAAKARISAEQEAAKKALVGTSESLAGEIVKVLLRPAAGPQGGVR